MYADDMASIAIALQKLLNVCFEYSIANRTVQDIYKSAILKFYFKLINNEIPQYFDTFTPPFSMGSNHYNIDNPCRQLPKINNFLNNLFVIKKMLCLMKQTQILF